MLSPRTYEERNKDAAPRKDYAKGLQFFSLAAQNGHVFALHKARKRASRGPREVAGDAQSGTLVNGALAGAQPGDPVVRGERVSLTIRHLLEFLLTEEEEAAKPPIGPPTSIPPMALSAKSSAACDESSRIV